MENKKELIFNMMPNNIKTVLDIGSRGNIFKNYKCKTIDDVEDADFKQDLNLEQNLKLPDNSFDMVVMNQILEHLCYVEKIIEESKRVSKKYLLIGLPNEVVYSLRIKYLFGVIEQSGYNKYGHKHRFGIREIEDFVEKFFGSYEKKVYFGAFTGAKFLPKLVVRFLANILPTLFAKEVFYLIDKSKMNMNICKAKQDANVLEGEQ